MRSKFAVVLFVLALSMPVAVIGAESPRPYASINGAFVMTSDSDAEDDDYGLTGEFGIKTGFGVVLAGGYALGNGVRTELEFGYRKADIESLTIDSFGKIDLDSAVSTLSLMGNALYVFQDIGFPVLPYAGAGIGVARHEIDSATITFQGVDLFVDSSDDFTFAYQFMAGVKYPLDAVEFGVGYRLMGTSDADFDGTEAEYMSHNFELGVTFKF